MDDHQPPDLVLVVKAKKNPSLFLALYQRHYKRVYVYHLARTGNEQDAQDLTSETFLAALNSLDAYRPERGNHNGRSECGFAKIWGTFQKIDEVPIIEVEHYEKAYPDEVYQAWLGREKVVTLEGRKALLFTDVSGKQYIFERSIENSPVDLEDGYRGEQFVVEGSLSHATFGGYPMILESMSFIAPGRTDLSGYQVQGNQVIEDYEGGGTPAPPPLAQDRVKDVVIDQVELVYFAYDFSHGGGYDLSTSPMRFVQPVWRFSGKLDDGRLVQVLVQAVTDDYLSEP